MSETTTASAFFYGTLMHPEILKRVINNDASHSQICPAVLLDYTRHHVKNGDYPGIVPYSKGKTIIDRELEPEEKSVRGTYVTGLRSKDIVLLDVFEGSEYSRDRVLVHPLGPLTTIEESSGAYIVPSKPEPLPAVAELAAPIEADAYVFHDLSDLHPELWSYEEFVKKNAWKWYGAASEGNSVYTEVDRRKNVN